MSVYVSGLMQSLTADQKQQHVSICKELCQIASHDTTFLPRVIPGMRAGFMVMTLKHSNNPPKGKMKSKAKSMLIIFFDIKGNCSQGIPPRRPNTQFFILL
jgi:hypothetical protein